MKKKYLLHIFTAFCLLIHSNLIAQNNKARINHLAIYVVDLQKSTHFYREIIGLDTMTEPFHRGVLREDRVRRGCHRLARNELTEIEILSAAPGLDIQMGWFPVDRSGAEIQRHGEQTIADAHIVGGNRLSHRRTAAGHVVKVEQEVILAIGRRTLVSDESLVGEAGAVNVALGGG